MTQFPFTRTLFVFLLFFQMIVSLSSQATSDGPIIYLRAKVDHLRLRAKPNKAAAVVAELPEHTQLMYLGESGGEYEKVTLRGVEHNARWYKVAPADKLQQSGWVYGGAVALSSVYLPAEGSPAGIQEDFLEIRRISVNEFTKNKANSKNLLLADTVQHVQRDGSILLTFDNGKQRIIQDTIDVETDGEGTTTYQYHGQFADIGQYVLELVGYEWNAIQFIDSRNGKTLDNLGFPAGLPVLAPNKKWVALANGDPYEDVGGLQVFFADHTGLYEAFNIQQPGRNATQLYWSAATGELYFNWESIFSDTDPPAQYFRMKILEP